jgi:carbonic anhydrase/acetyltransferase-like protein (isoleucine patch superfamily)
MRHLALLLFLKSLRAFDRARLRLRMALRPGLDVDPDASSNFAAARFSLGPGARLRIGPGAVTERRSGALNFVLGPGAVVEVGDTAWLRTEVGAVNIVAFAGARIAIGPDCLLNGAYISAKREVRLGHHTNIGMGSRVFDSDQHDFDADRPEASDPVHIGEFVWIASDVTVLRGVTIGDHSIVGTRSLVTRDVPPHTLVFGAPAAVRGSVGDRSQAS